MLLRTSGTAWGSSWGWQCAHTNWYRFVRCVRITRRPIMGVMGIRRTTSAPPLLGRFSRHCAVNEVRGGAWHARTPAQLGGSARAGWIGCGLAARSTWLHATTRATRGATRYPATSRTSERIVNKQRHALAGAQGGRPPRRPPTTARNRQRPRFQFAPTMRNNATTADLSRVVYYP